MPVSDDQITNVIKAYMKNTLRGTASRGGGHAVEDCASLSDEGMKRMFFERIEETIGQRSRSHEPDESDGVEIVPE